LFLRCATAQNSLSFQPAGFGCQAKKRTIHVPSNQTGSSSHDGHRFMKSTSPVRFDLPGGVPMVSAAT